MKSAPENLATLPLKQAMRAAKADGRAALQDPSVFDDIYYEIQLKWLDKRIPRAAGQTDDEFSEFVAKVAAAFCEGLDETITKLSKGHTA
jgi:hypothetical protein